jgi:hypothetical protein
LKTFLNCNLKICNAIHFVNMYGSIFWKNENGELHREDGPAIEDWNGNKEWYLHGELHRRNGPAIEYRDGGKEWWLHINDRWADDPKSRSGYRLDEYGWQETGYSLYTYKLILSEHDLKLKLLSQFLIPGSETLVDKYTL